MSKKPSSRIVANALSRNDHFVAQFSLPGLVPSLISINGKPRTFKTEVEAKYAAMEQAINSANARAYDKRPAGANYERLSGAELSKLLDEIEITPTYFAEIVGVRQFRVMHWLDGEQEIPHYIHALARLLAKSGDNFDLAEKLAEDMQKKKNDRSEK